MPFLIFDILYSACVFFDAPGIVRNPNFFFEKHIIVIVIAIITITVNIVLKFDSKIYLIYWNFLLESRLPTSYYHHHFYYYHYYNHHYYHHHHY